MGIYHRLKDWQVSWSELEGKVKNCINDCEHFGMPVPSMNGYEKVKNQMEQELGNWKLFADYNAELEVLGKEQWITFRGQLYKLADLNVKYLALLKDVEREDIVSKYMNGVLQAGTTLIPLLKLMGGENFERDHWATLFHLLGIDKEVTTSDKLLVSHLLEIDVMEKINEIRELEMRAKGEITIRDSLGELGLWSDTREF